MNVLDKICNHGLKGATFVFMWFFLPKTCTPSIGLYGCQIKDKYDRYCWLLFGDSNDQYLPITFGFIETKSKTLGFSLLTYFLSHWWL